MTLARLLNTQATVIRRLPSAETDRYGNSIPTEDETNVVCEVQQQRRDEPDDQGETSDTYWLGIFPAGTDIETGDAVRVDGLGEFEVFGNPWPARNPRTQSASHIETTLRRTAGSEDGS